MKIWLIGMMGSGKTSTGLLAASRLGVEFLDTDELAEARAGEAIEDLWAARGEAVFRELERSVIADLAEREGIVATGGGVVLDEQNRETMRRSGVVVWLEASPGVLSDRVGVSSGRPLLDSGGGGAEKVLTRTLSERVSLYAETAHHRIVTDDLDVAAVSDRIEDIWKS